MEKVIIDTQADVDRYLDNWYRDIEDIYFRKDKDISNYPDTALAFQKVRSAWNNAFSENDHQVYIVKSKERDDAILNFGMEVAKNLAA